MRNSLSPYIKRLARHKWPKKSEKSPYHELAALYQNSYVNRARIFDGCLGLGLRSRALELSSALGGELSLLQRLELAALFGDMEQIQAVAVRIYEGCIKSRGNSKFVAPLTQRLAPILPGVVREIGEELGMDQVPSYAAVVSMIDPDAARRLFGKHELLSLGGDGRLLAANLSSDQTEKLRCLQDYFSFHGLPPALSAGSLFSWGEIDARAAPVESDIKPKPVSVIVTAYNCEALIQASLLSLLNQSLPPSEIIVVDDASTDRTAEKVRALSSSNRCISLITLPANVGTYKAKNVGLLRAGGDYVTFQDADDLSHPNRLETCAQELQSDIRLVAVSCNYLRVDREGVFHSPKVWPLTQWSPNTLFFDRRCVSRYGLLMDDTRFGGDSEYAARMKYMFGSIAHRKIKKPLLLASHREESLMTSRLTGLNAQGMSMSRVAYQEEWSERLLSAALRDVELGR
ncbi:glycosyltransferase family 2 protein [Achromobacter sp. NPDC058515]|uniref:glycosyltransferase family 2 protein n=1 Tax=Achromobacter sp. NPDC058515 TaxID=3346533 RepID=UPI00366413AE